jgi:hypothetical protein
MLSGLGSMHEVLQASGRQARRDVMRQAWPMYGLARVASWYRPLPPLARGIAALLTASAAVGGAIVLLQKVQRWATAERRRVVHHQNEVPASG